MSQAELFPEHKSRFQARTLGDREEKDRKRHKEWVLRNPEKQIKASRRWCQNNPTHTWAMGSLRRHRKLGYDVQITAKELVKITASIIICRYCGRKMEQGRGRHNYRDISPSVDRINNELQLRKDNVQKICRQCNATKGRRTHDEFINYCQRVLDLNQARGEEEKNEQIKLLETGTAGKQPAI